MHEFMDAIGTTHAHDSRRAVALDFFIVGMRPASGTSSEVALPTLQEEHLALFADVGVDQIAGEASILHLRSHIAARRLPSPRADVEWGYR